MSDVSGSGVGAGLGVGVGVGVGVGAGFSFGVSDDDSPFSMVPVAVPSMITDHLDGSERVSVMVSALSSRGSVRTGTRTVRDCWPDGKVSLPLVAV